MITTNAMRKVGMVLRRFAGARRKQLTALALAQLSAMIPAP